MTELTFKQRVYLTLKTNVQNSESSGDVITVEAISELYDLAVQIARVQFSNRNTSSIELNEDDREAICKRIELDVNVFQGEASRIIDNSTHVPWLDNRRAEISWGYWACYQNHVSQSYPPQVVTQLNVVTDQILDQIKNPKTKGQWDSRGLVMGHVQSGKTLNYLGLICKAVDAGYKIIIVLTGLHDSLRTQTQTRIDEGFIGRDTRIEAGNHAPKIGVGFGASHKVPTAFTAAQQNGDFNKNTASSITMDIGGEDAKIFVVKKNVTILKNLREWLNLASSKPVGHERVADIPLLIIDDEADQASVDTKGGASPSDPEHEPSAINERIRGILNDFDQSAYVGYTATPFANIFIQDSDSHPEHGLDLFPKDFIYSLEAPSNYVGADKLFGFPSSNDDSTNSGLPLTRVIGDIDAWIPAKHKLDLIPGKELPHSLIKAIDTFILVCAARLLRGTEPHHNTMLIHVTRFIAVQERIKTQVLEHITKMRETLDGDFGDSLPRDRLRELWNKDFTPTTKVILQNGHDFGAASHTFKEVEKYIELALSRINTLQISGTSTDVLSYKIVEGTGRSFIAIGGDKLSRGLTLEHLSVSYYGRPSRMYDTLMQMGRWFGYRYGYQDLCRIWTTPEIASWYSAIAFATSQLVSDFKEMAREGLTPKQFGLKVATHPGLMITNRTKLRNGTRRKVTYSNWRPEITTFEKGDREEDFDDAEFLINEAKKISHSVGSTGGDLLFKNIPAEPILNYLERLSARSAYKNAKSFDSVNLLAYIKKRLETENLSEWTILLKSKISTDNRRELAGLDIGLSFRRNVNRYPNGDPNPNEFVTKSLIGSEDERVDLEPEEVRAAYNASNGNRLTARHIRSARSPKRGLLILYLLEGHPAIGPTEYPFVGVSLSLPDDGIGETVNVMTNSVWEALER